MTQPAESNKPARSGRFTAEDYVTPAMTPESRVVLRPLSAFIAAHFDLTKKGCSEDQAFRVARDAYILYMPLLIDRKSIHDYIACVSQGVLHKVFEPKEANSLLYAAQIALSLQRKSGRKTNKR